MLDYLKRFIPDISDVLTFGGIGTACWGIHAIYPPAAFIVGGVAAFWLGIKK
jgi:hypothetical protein